MGRDINFGKLNKQEYLKSQKSVEQVLKETLPSSLKESTRLDYPGSMRRSLTKLRDFEKDFAKAGDDLHKLFVVKEGVRRFWKSLTKGFIVEMGDKLTYPDETVESVRKKITDFEKELDLKLEHLQMKKKAEKDLVLGIQMEKEAKKLLEILEDKLDIAMNRVEELNYNQTKRQFNLILKKSSDKELLDKANLVFAQIDQLYREIIEKKDQEKKQQDVVRYIVYFQNRLKKNNCCGL
ncbi:hypothetical protein HC864_00460 [Candidatus Gracilibacteria bacterium]|nr:hypothetical protein [Candidatus Gracilibacteria bacterium]